MGAREISGLYHGFVEWTGIPVDHRNLSSETENLKNNWMFFNPVGK